MMETLFTTSREPKTLELENTDDGRLRLVITLKKLGGSPAWSISWTKARLDC